MKVLLYRLFDAMGRIPQDKALHFVWGQVLAMAAFLAFGRDLKALALSGLITVAVAWAKEMLLDKGTPGHECSPYDLLATLLGGVPVWVLAVMIVRARHG